MKKIIITLLLFVAFLFSILPSMLGASYALGGRQAFMKFVTETAEGRFWMVGIPLFIITLAGSCGIFILIYYNAFGSMKPKKKVYYLKDEDGKRSEVFDGEGNKVEFMDLGKKDSI
jgi:hypothetical protein